MNRKVIGIDADNVASAYKKYNVAQIRISMNGWTFVFVNNTHVTFRYEQNRKEWWLEWHREGSATDDGAICLSSIPHWKVSLDVINELK